MIELSLEPTIIEKHKNWIFGENKNKSNRLYQQLKSHVEKETDEDIKKILKSIFLNLKTIIIGNYSTLDKIRKEFDIDISVLRKKELTRKHKVRGKEIHIGEKEISLYKILKKIFVEDEYKYFYKSPKWNAYLFHEALNLSICPYCGTQFIFLSSSEEGKTRATLDHFFDKASYPFLGVSIYNLVPSCKVCNYDFKGSIHMDLDNNYIPYEKNITKYIKFKIEMLNKISEKVVPIEVGNLKMKSEAGDIDYFSVLTGASTDFNILIDIEGCNDSTEKKIKGNLKVFNLDKIYNTYHRDYVRSLIKKAYIYNRVYRDGLTENFKVFIGSEADLKNLLFSNVQDDHNIILGKLTRDIVLDELNL